MQGFARSLMIAIVAITTAIIAVGFVGGRPQTANAATSGISIQNFRFSPATISIKVGEQVRWINDESAVPHTATSEKPGAFGSKTLRPGDSYLTEPFAVAGSYQYLCLIHPTMRAVVNVGEASGSPSTPFAALTTAPIALRLQGSQEVPPVTTIASGAFNAKVVGNSLTWAAQAYGSGITQAHIHSGAAGTNGPVVAFLFGPDTGGQNLLNLSGTITEADLVGPMAGKWADFSRALASGQLYVNFHTIANPGGEVRAQLGASPGAPSTGSSVDTGSRGLSWFLMMSGVLLAVSGGLVLGVKAKARR